MTESTPDDKARPTRVVTIAGRSIVVRELVDMQLMHIGRYARILQRDDVAGAEKIMAVDRMLTILHSCVADPADLAYLIEQEETGKITIRDMMGFASATDAPNDEDAKPAVVRRRAPARRK